MNDEPEGPAFEVWNHLESGWQQAYDDMARQLDPETMKLFETVASIVVGGTSAFHLDEAMAPVREKMKELAPNLDSSRYELVFSTLLDA